MRPPPTVLQALNPSPPVSLEPLVARLPTDLESPAHLTHDRRDPGQAYKIEPLRHDALLMPWHDEPPKRTSPCILAKVLPMSPNACYLCTRSVHRERGERDDWFRGGPGG